MCRISRLKCNIGHGPLSACRAVGRRRPASQARNWRCVLVDSPALLLWRHTGLLCVAGLLYMARLLYKTRLLYVTRLLGLDIRALLLQLWRAGVLLCLRLRVHGLLLLVLHVRVLVVDRWLLACNVWRLGELLHWYTLLLHCDDVCWYSSEVSESKFKCCDEEEACEQRRTECG